MTTPRDALRAIELEWRKRANLYGDNYALGLIRCADELADILSQMDSEPTVAQWREPSGDGSHTVRSLLHAIDSTLGGSKSRRTVLIESLKVARELAAKDKQL
jgi:hypothetical protein